MGNGKVTEKALLPEGDMASKFSKADQDHWFDLKKWRFLSFSPMILITIYQELFNFPTFQLFNFSTFEPSHRYSSRVG